MKCDFSYDHYRDCLRIAKGKGYQFLRFDEINQKDIFKKTIFMRHDVDHSIDLALKLAQIENCEGVSATYFLRLHSPRYNLLSIPEIKKVEEIVNLGHEIGFHYEPDFQSADLWQFDHDLELLRSLGCNMRFSISSVSVHEPLRSGVKEIPELWMRRTQLRQQAYEDRFVKDMKYISDSSCNWREGCMHQWIGDDCPHLHILTHGIWWYNETPLENY